MSGGVVGTPAYIAPEVWHGDKAAAQTDVYALGCILYEMVTGKELFTGATPPAVMLAHFQPPALPDDWPHDAPPGLTEVLARAMSMGISNRYATAGEFGQAVAGLGHDRAQTENEVTVTLSTTPKTGKEQKTGSNKDASQASTEKEMQPAEDVDQEKSQVGDAAADTTAKKTTTYPSPYTYLAPKRRHQQLCEVASKKVIIPSYPSVPNLPENPFKNNLYYVGIVLIVLVAVGFALTAPPELAVATLILAVVVVVSFIIMLKSKDRELEQAYSREVEHRRWQYSKQIESMKDRLEQERSAYRECLVQRSPAPNQCLAIVKTSDTSQIWTRRPEHSDFFDIRIGLGDLAFPVTIQSPIVKHTNMDEALVEKVESLIGGFQKTPDSPISIPLADHRVIGVIGEPRRAAEFVNAVLVQIAAHHSPRDVKIMAYHPNFESSDWAWMRWLPHVWSNNHKVRYLSTNRNDLASFIQDVEATHVVIVTTDTQLAQERKFKKLLNSGNRLKASMLVVSDSQNRLSSRSNLIIDLTNDIIQLRVGGKAQIMHRNVNTDGLSTNRADLFARLMAPFRLETKEVLSELSESEPKSPTDRTATHSTIYRIALDGKRISLPKSGDESVHDR
jgi:serine/threonine protein kinase